MAPEVLKELDMHLSRRGMMTVSAAAVAAAALPKAALASATHTLTPAQMRADLDFFKLAYETVHPGLLRYLPPGAFVQRVEAAKVWAERDRSLSDMFIALTRLTAAVKCGHSHPNPFNQGRAARAALFGARSRMPFAFRWIDGQMIVTGERARTSSVLSKGTRILAVDGIPTERILASMTPLSRADGSNDAKRIAQLGIGSDDRFAAFDVFRPMLFPPPSSEAIRLDLVDPSGLARRIDLAALTEEDIQRARAPDDAPLDWTFDIRSDGIGLLTMSDWTTYRSQWDWRAFLDQAIDRLIDERARGLIIDIRGNEGGTECGWHLLGRLVAQDLPLPRFNRKLRYRTLPNELRPNLDTWDDRFRDWGEAVEGPDVNGFYEFASRSDDGNILLPRGRRFAGAACVLVDAACSSATFQFANAIAGKGLASLVGEPTGGNRRGINGDGYFFVRLPGTGLEVDLPIVGHFSADQQPDAGIVPDRLVPLTAEDIALGRDRQLEAAVRTLGGAPQP